MAAGSAISSDGEYFQLSEEGGVRTEGKTEAALLMGCANVGVQALQGRTLEHLEGVLTAGPKVSEMQGRFHVDIFLAARANASV